MTVWRGTAEEMRELLRLATNCSCRTQYSHNLGQAVLEPCELHKALAGDQRFLDHLLFYRRMWRTLIAQEFGGTGWEQKPEAGKLFDLEETLITAAARLPGQNPSSGTIVEGWPWENKP